MSLDITLHTAPAVPLEAEVLSPTRLAGLSALDAAKLVVVHGNLSAELGEFFTHLGLGQRRDQSHRRSLAGEADRRRHDRRAASWCTVPSGCTSARG